MKIERTVVFGWQPALRAMRNPKDSWDKSDSRFYGDSEFAQSIPYYPQSDDLPRIIGPKPPWDWENVRVPELPSIGPKDMELACGLIKGGSEHRKFLRQIIIWADLTLPRFCWQEMDTYKVATVRNSCSTMHKLGSRELTQEDFELPVTQTCLDDLNVLIREFQGKKEQKSKEVRDVRRELKNALPEGFLQKATYTMSYETALAWLRQRSNHRLDEWNIKVPGSLCNWAVGLPYMAQFAEAAFGKSGE